MNETLFKLLSTYELVFTLSTIDRPVRMEIFKSLDDEFLYRARIWMQNTYNLYPSFINTDENGEDLHNVHSNDQVDMDITALITNGPGIITGRHYASESDFVSYLKSRIIYFRERFEK